MGCQPWTVFMEKNYKIIIFRVWCTKKRAMSEINYFLFEKFYRLKFTSKPPKNHQTTYQLSEVSNDTSTFTTYLPKLIKNLQTTCSSVGLLVSGMLQFFLKFLLYCITFHKEEFQSAAIGK